MKPAMTDHLLNAGDIVRQKYQFVMGAMGVVSYATLRSNLRRRGVVVQAFGDGRCLIDWGHADLVMTDRDLRKCSCSRIEGMRASALALA